MKPTDLLRACGAATGRALRSSALLSVVGFACLASAATIWVPGGTGTGIADNTSNTNVGIGTNSPSYKLSVNGTIGIGPDEIPIQQTYFGYNSAYKVLRLGLDQSSRALALNVDPSTVTGSSFTCLGQILIGNKGVLAPNSAGTDWMGVLRAAAGKVYLGGSLASGEVSGDGLVVSGTSVGIGTTSPSYKLSVNGTIAIGPDEIPIQQTYFGYSSVYKVLRLGLDQSFRALALNVDPSTVTGSSFTSLGQILIGNKGVLAPNAAGTDWMGVLRAAAGKVYLGGSLAGGEVSGDGLVVSGTNVGIGTNSPSHKLAVNGSIRAKEVIVDTGWSDYVFADNYRLAPLSEVEAHIKAEKHLPGIPSAAEVAQGGVSLGDMQAKLLAKVEELTLHQIAQEKELTRLKRQNEHLQQELSELQSR